MSRLEQQVHGYCAECLSLTQPNSSLCFIHAQESKPTDHVCIFYNIKEDVYQYKTNEQYQDNIKKKVKKEGFNEVLPFSKLKMGAIARLYRM